MINTKLSIALATLGAVALLLIVTVSTSQAQAALDREIPEAAVTPPSSDDESDSLLVSKRRGGGRISMPRRSAPRISRPTPRMFAPRISRPIHRFSPSRISRPVPRISPPKISRPSIHMPTHISCPTWQRPNPVARIPDHRPLSMGRPHQGSRPWSSIRPRVRDSMLRPGNNFIHSPTTPRHSTMPHIAPNPWRNGPTGFITPRLIGQSGLSHRPAGHNSGTTTLPRGFSRIGNPNPGLTHLRPTVVRARPNVVTSPHQGVASRLQPQTSIGNRVTTAS